MNGINKNKIIGISRVRNVELIITDVLNHLNNILHGVIIYDDASSDDTLKIVKNHPLVIEIIENKNWIKDKFERQKVEGEHRQVLYETAKKYFPDWIYVFDADEFIELDDNIDLNDENLDSYFFRLFDYYITPFDFDKKYKERNFIGPEYRDIPMLFRANLNLKFNSRVPNGYKKISFGGYVKHYGKAISIKEWEKKCNYYINHLNEEQPGGKGISEKWLERKDKAIHLKSDFYNELITWDKKEIFGIELSHNLEWLASLKLNILIASASLNELGGSETFTYTIIEELKKYPKLHIEYFTFFKGEVSERIEQDLGVQFKSLKKYDLILANHFTVVNRLYKCGFIIQTCHGIYPKLEQPNKKANGFVAISQEVQDYLAEKGFVSRLIYNSININRFYPESNLNLKPKKILSLCHSEDANNIIKEICSEMSFEYLEAFKFKNPIWNIEKIINEADLVFGLGRSAYEAMSCGRPVIVFDNRIYFPSYGDGYIRNNIGLSLLNNCSGRYSRKHYSKEQLKKEINKYNHNDSSFFREFSKKHLDARLNIVKYFEYYFSLKQIESDKKIKVKVKRYLKRKLKIVNKSKNEFYNKIKRFIKIKIKFS